jgi:hypothetical protein
VHGCVNLMSGSQESANCPGVSPQTLVESLR